MINYTRFFNELDCPPAGIDTISIWVHDNLINRFDDFNPQGNIHESINCRYRDEINKKTGQFFRRNYFIDIQSEALNPNNDILEQIINILSKFIFIGTLRAFKNIDIYDTSKLLMNNISSLFAINSVDFYFDLKEEDCILLGEPNPYPNTRYSLDYPSCLKVYSKTNRHIAKNHKSYQNIEQMKYKTRIEFHLVNSNCNFLHFQNLRGTFEIVFYHYLPQLARKWFDHRREVVKIQKLYELPYAHHLRQINEMALAGHIPQYRDLLKTPIRPKPEKHYGKNEVDLNWLSNFKTV